MVPRMDKDDGQLGAGYESFLSRQDNINGGQGKRSGQIGAGQEARSAEAADDKGKAFKRRFPAALSNICSIGVQADMQNLENKYQYPLDEDYKDLIIDDIRKQLDTRIQHYVNQYRGVGFKEPMEAVTTSIMEKTKQDIITAIESYISSLPKAAPTK